MFNVYGHYIAFHIKTEKANIPITSTLYCSNAYNCDTQIHITQLLLLLQAFPAYHRRVAGVVNFFHFLRSCVSSRTAPMFSISSLMLSLHLLLGLPLFRFPGSAMCSVLNATWSPPLLSMCPYHLNLALRIWTVTFSIFSLSLTVSFLTWSNLVQPHVHRHILISATSSFLSCLAVNGTVSIAGNS